MAVGPQQQWSVGYGPVPPQARPSTRTLTVTKWISVVLVVLLIPLMVLWTMQGHENLESLRSYAQQAAAGSGDGKGLKGGAEAIAHWEFLIVLQYITTGAVVLIGILALLAGAGMAWARVLCTILILGPIGVVIYGVLDSGEEGLYGLVFLVPFFLLQVLWWLPGTTRGLRVKAAARRPRY